MSPKTSRSNKPTEKIDMAVLRDLTRTAVERADRIVGDACGLIEVNHYQYMLAVNVIGNLIIRASSMLVDGDALRKQDIDFTLEAVKTWLDHAK